MYLALLGCVDLREAGDRVTMASLLQLNHSPRDKATVLKRSPSTISREHIGHWEVDTVIGVGHKQAIVTLVKRKSRMALQDKVQFYGRKFSEQDNLELCRSLYFVRDMKAEDVIAQEFARSVGPGFWLASRYYDQFIGRKVRSDVRFATAVRLDLVGSNEKVIS